jgi:hypothetical protein
MNTYCLAVGLSIVDRDVMDAGGVTTNNADELIGFVKDLRVDVVEWLRQNHPELLPPPG